VGLLLALRDNRWYVTDGVGSCRSVQTSDLSGLLLCSVGGSGEETSASDSTSGDSSSSPASSFLGLGDVRVVSGSGRLRNLFLQLLLNLLLLHNSDGVAVCLWSKTSLLTALAYDFGNSSWLLGNLACKRSGGARGCSRLNCNTGVLFGLGVHTHRQAGLWDHVAHNGRQAKHAALSIALSLRSQTKVRQCGERVGLCVRSRISPCGTLNSVRADGAWVRDLFARCKVDWVAEARGCWNGRDAKGLRLGIFLLPVVTDSRLYCVVCERARVGHWLSRGKVNRVTETCGGSNGGDVEALGFALRRFGGRGHGESTRDRLLRLGLFALLGHGASKASSGRLRRSGGEGADGLVDNVFRLENIVHYAVAIVLLARALVDDPIAIDDKLETC
jgi:hypothetical protein